MHGLKRCLTLLWPMLLATPRLHAQAAPDTHEVTARDEETEALLQPVRQAPQQVASWEQARHLLAGHQPALSRSAAAVAEAEADATGALARMLPELQANLGAEYNSGRASSFTSKAGDIVPGASVLLSGTVSVANVVRYDGAKRALVASQRASEATRHRLLVAVGATLLAVVAAERIASRNRAGLSAAHDRLRMAERLVELGRASALSAARFSQDLYEAQAAVVTGDEALWQAREALGHALGLGEAVGVAASFDVATLPLDARALGCTPLPALAERADLQEARQRAHSAERSVQAARLAYLPELQLNTGYSAIRAPIPPETSPEWINNLSVTASIAFSAFDGGQRRAALQSARAELVRARAEQRELENVTRTEYRRARRALNVAQQNVEIAQRDLVAAARSDELSRRAFELGNASALEGVDAAKRLRAAEITLTLRGVELLDAELRALLLLAQCR